MVKSPHKHACTYPRITSGHTHAYTHVHAHTHTHIHECMHTHAPPLLPPSNVKQCTSLVHPHPSVTPRNLTNNPVERFRIGIPTPHTTRRMFVLNGIITLALGIGDTSIFVAFTTENFKVVVPSLYIEFEYPFSVQPPKIKRECPIMAHAGYATPGGHGPDSCCSVQSEVAKSSINTVLVGANTPTLSRPPHKYSFRPTVALQAP